MNELGGPLSGETGPSTVRGVALERVRAMEALAGIVAHELRSSVLGLTSAAQLLRYAIPADPVAERSLGRILHESERLTALHEGLSEYATELPPRSAPVDPDFLWQTVIGNLRGALEASGVRATHAVTGRVTVAADEEQLTRALERVVLHAVSRTNAGGEIRIESSGEGEWRSTVDVVQPDSSSRAAAPDSDRTTFRLALVSRTLIAHGGELMPVGDAAPTRIATLRLPLATHFV